ncbi:MAG: hypothetical protein K2M55_07750 [Muribaculaceae bacterium]|nr:hypothetical protein [Muribaculaceae bacterium]
MYEVALSNDIRTDIKGYQHLVDVFADILGQEDKEVTIVFDGCEHIDANLSAVLGSLFDELKSQGFQIWLTNPTNAQVRDNLSRNNFFSAFNPDCNTEDTENFIEYRRFKPEESKNFKSYIETQLMQKQKFPAHTEKAGRLIQESIMEIFVNAVSHGECAYVYSCGEYDGTKAPPCLDMTIVDRGHSIPAKVNDYMTRRDWQPMTACQAIRWALMDGNTTKDIPGGLGLSTLMEFLKLNQGSMQIVSGNGMVEYRDNRLLNYDMARSFDGTIVNMEFNFDDDKNYRLVDEPVDLSNLL